jgi:DNA-directed RNA polymerase specialized sigma24 family protein
MNPFTRSQELRFARVAARATRNLPRDVRTDVFAAAYIKARETYQAFDAERGDGTMECRLDNWFFGLLLNAKKKIRRENRPPLGVAVDALEALTGGDDSEAEAIRNEAFEQLTTPEDLAIMAAIQRGASVRQAARQCKVNVNHVKRIKRNIRDHLQVAARTVPARREPLGASDDDAREKAPIDHEIEKLLRRPSTASADCPICWRCAWFSGLLPVRYRAPRFVDKEVADAMLRTDLRKIDIANGTEARDFPEDEPTTRSYKRLEFLFPYYDEALA